MAGTAIIPLPSQGAEEIAMSTMLFEYYSSSKA